MGACAIGIVAAAIAAATLASPAVASATTDICAGHMDQKDASFGYASSGEDPKFISTCDGDSGPDAYNNAVTPDARPHPDARPPLQPSTASTDGGTYDATQNIRDSDGLQADDVRNSPIFTPGH